jgi:hypothetical protein
MSIAEGHHPDDFDEDLARQFVNESSKHPANNPTTKDSEENEICEINELLVSIRMKPDAEEMLKKDPVGLMKLIMGEESGGDWEDSAAGRRGGRGDKGGETGGE